MKKGFFCDNCGNKFQVKINHKLVKDQDNYNWYYYDTPHDEKEDIKTWVLCPICLAGDRSITMDHTFKEKKK